VGQDALSDEFVKRHYAGLQSLLQRRIKDSAIASEMLNEALALAISHLRVGRISEPDRLAGYVYRVALNLYRNYRREFDNRADLRASPDHIQDVPASCVESNESQDRLLKQVRAVIEALPTPRDREIVKRFYLDEEDKSAICASLGLSPLHFDKVVHRARQRMKVLLEAKGFDKGDLLSILFVSCAFLCA